MVNYYRRFVPNFSLISKPLQDCLHKFHNSPRKFLLTNEASSAIEKLKTALVNAVTLAHCSKSSNTFQLVTDASGSAVGAALHQLQDGQYNPIGFYSKKLTEAQTKYSTFDRELLAAFQAVLYFRSTIEGQNVTLFADHKPLISAFHSTTVAKSDRQQRHLSLLTEFLSDAQYIRGRDNVVADTLSRSVNAIECNVVDLEHIAISQDADTETKTYQERLKPFPVGKHKLWCNTDNPIPRPFLPFSLRNKMIHKLHDLSHPGIKSTIRLLKERYVWPEMDKTIKEFCNLCQRCQAAKVGKHTKPSHSFHLPVSSRFQAVHIDIVGPLPRATAKGQQTESRYLVTFIDRATRWVEATPIADITAETISSVFLNTWVSRFGVPLYVVTDRGTQFEAEMFHQLSKVIGFHRLRSTAYHPQTNGMVERFHRTLKTSLTARGSNWIEDLPIVLLGIRCIPNENGLAPFTAVTGQCLLTPHSVASEPTVSTNLEFIQRLAKTMKEVDFALFSHGINNNTQHKPYLPNALNDCSHVWIRVDRVRRPLEAPFSGPYKVLKRGSKTVTIEKEDGRQETISMSRIKPARIVSQSTPKTTAPLPTPAKAAEGDWTRTRRKVRFKNLPKSEE